MKEMDFEEALTAYLLRRYYWDCQKSEITGTANFDYLLNHPYSKLWKQFGTELRQFYNQSMKNFKDGYMMEKTPEEMCNQILEKIREKTKEKLEKDTYTLYRGVVLPKGQKIYTPRCTYESWTDDLNVAISFSFHFHEFKSSKEQGIVLKKEIPKEQILTTYFLNDFWEIMEDDNQHEFIIHDLQTFELTEETCLKKQPIK